MTDEHPLAVPFQEASTEFPPDRVQASAEIPAGEFVHTDDLRAGGDPRSDEADETSPTPAEKRIRTLVEWVAVVVGALAMALLIKTFLVQAFYIKWDSMEPTLLAGDRLMVDKISYRWGDISRGDIVVFEGPSLQAGHDDEALIKRVVGLEGEMVELRDGNVYVDGSLLGEAYLEPGTITSNRRNIPGCVNSPSPTRCFIADGTVFVLGDNRETSRDSRFFGPVDADRIVGRAWLRFWPLSEFGAP